MSCGCAHRKTARPGGTANDAAGALYALMTSRPMDFALELVGLVAGIPIDPALVVHALQDKQRGRPVDADVKQSMRDNGAFLAFFGAAIDPLALAILGLIPVTAPAVPYLVPVAPLHLLCSVIMTDLGNDRPIDGSVAADAADLLLSLAGFIGLDIKVPSPIREGIKAAYAEAIKEKPPKQGQGSGENNASVAKYTSAGAWKRAWDAYYQTGKPMDQTYQAPLTSTFIPAVDAKYVPHNADNSFVYGYGRRHYGAIAKIQTRGAIRDLKTNSIRAKSGLPPVTTKATVKATGGGGGIIAAIAAGLLALKVLA